MEGIVELGQHPDINYYKGAIVPRHPICKPRSTRGYNKDVGSSTLQSET